MTLLLLQAAWAGQASFRLATDDLHEGQTVALELVISDAAPRGVPSFGVPEGLSVRFESQSQTQQIINFQRTSETTFRYALTMLSPGEYTIPPAGVATSDGTLNTAPLRLQVEPRRTGDLEALVGTVASDVAWVGQVIVYHLRFETDERMVDGGWSLPTAPGFTAEPSVEPQTREYEVEQDGKARAVKELDVPLRAASPGKWSIAGAVLRARFAVAEPRSRRRPSVFDGMGAFANVRDENYAARPVEVNVRALPSEGRPAGETPLVGQFEVSARASQATARVGDTITVEVTVTGSGDLGGFKLPLLEGKGFRVYDDQPAVTAQVEGGRYQSTATFKRAIVPESPGPLEIPAFELPYFDPVSGAWASARVDPVRIDVEGQAEVANLKTFGEIDPKKGVDALGEDILPVRTSPRTSAPWPSALALGLLAPGLLGIAAEALALLRKKKPTAEVTTLRFEDLPVDPEARLLGLQRIFRENAAGRLGISPEALKAEDLAGLGPLAEEALALYRVFERAHYGGATETSPEPRVRAFTEAPR